MSISMKANDDPTLEDLLSFYCLCYVYGVDPENITSIFLFLLFLFLLFLCFCVVVSDYKI